MTSQAKTRCFIYGALALGALVATWTQNLTFMALPNNGGLMGFIHATTANPAAASITYDITFFLAAAFVLMAVEAKKLKIRFVWAYFIVAFVIAVSVAFPLFLIARERALAKLDRPQPT